MILSRNSTQKNLFSAVEANKTIWTNRSSSPRLQLVKSSESASCNAVTEVQKLVKKLVEIEGINRVRAIATSFPDIHWIDFEIKLEAKTELSDENWDKIQDLVIDCEWKLRDGSGEKWYFRPQVVDSFSLLKDEVIADDGKQHRSIGRLKTWSSNSPKFVVL